MLKLELGFRFRVSLVASTIDDRFVKIGSAK